MKRLFLSLLTCSALLISSCGGDGEYVEDGPDDTASGAFTCTISGDFTQSFIGDNEYYGLYGSGLSYRTSYDETDISIELGQYDGPGTYTWSNLPENPNKLFVDKDGNRYVGNGGSLTITSEVDGVISGTFEISASIQTAEAERIELTSGSFTLSES